MDNGMNNLDKLTDQIFKEGIEKAELQSKEIIQEVEANKTKMISEAKEEAEKILAEANREAERLKRSIENELVLKGEQFVSDLKVKIENLLSDEILKTNTKTAFSDPKFVESVIFEVLKHWDINNDVELILPSDLEKKIKDSLTKSIKETAPTLTITYDSNVNSGFRIARKSDNFQISFGTDEFVDIFKIYLSDQANKLLFK